MKGLTSTTVAIIALSGCRAGLPRFSRSVRTPGRWLSTALLSYSPNGAQHVLNTRTSPFCRRLHSTNAVAASVCELKSELVHGTLLLNDLSNVVDYQGALDSETTKQSLQRVMEKFHRNERLTKEFILELLDHSIMSHKTLPNVIHVNRAQAPTSVEGAVHYTSNLTVVGDVHGQYADFAQIFEHDSLGGYPSTSNQFIFNGDLVDRGDKALEIVTTVLLAKALCPSSVHILRGNHETASMYEHYGFASEVLRKYDHEVLDRFRQFFDTLPLAAVVEDAVFVVHGGIGPACVNMTLEDINGLNRFGEPEFQGTVGEFLWSDPKDNVLGFRFNRARGGGHCFGPDVTRAFLANNGLSFLIRSHEVCMQGVQMLHGGLCATVFSAPNYCGDMGNLGAVIRFMEPDSMKATAVQFSAAPRVKSVVEDSVRRPEVDGSPQAEGALPQEETKPWWRW